MGRARRTERGEEGRESLKRLEKERETETERERREEKTEATTVGKIRKWQEMGSCEQGADRLPTRPPATASTPPPGLGLRPCLPMPSGQTAAGAFSGQESTARRQESPGRVRGSRESQDVGGTCLGHQGQRRTPPPPTPKPQVRPLHSSWKSTRGGKAAWRQRGEASPHHRVSGREMPPSSRLGSALGASSTSTKRPLSVRHGGRHTREGTPAPRGSYPSGGTTGQCWAWENGREEL